MEKSYQMDEIIDSFIKQFNCSMSYEPIPLGLGNAHAFFIKMEDVLLNEVWKDMRNFIAIKFQNNLSVEFDRWNVYIFYIASTFIDNDLKYQIENDTFSSRKIVIEGVFDLQKIIEEHILNSDITIDSTPISESNFTPNPIIYNQLENLEVKSKVTDALKAAHLKIKNIIKKESHEI